MYTLIVYFVLSGQFQTVQIDGFSSKEKCEVAYKEMLPFYTEFLFTENKTDTIAYCVEK